MTRVSTSLSEQAYLEIRNKIVRLELAPGDVVCGVLPLGLAAKLCAQGVRVLAIDMALPEHLRGVELSAEQLDALQARLVEYRVSAREVGIGLSGGAQPGCP